MSQEEEGSTRKRKHEGGEASIIFTIARMNPPTSGHMKLVHTLIQTAIRLHEKKVYILLSQKNGTQRNPLICAEKRVLLLNGMIKKVQVSYPTPVEVEIMCDDDDMPGCGDTYIVKELCHLMKPYKEQKGLTINLHLIIGQDREFAFTWIQKVLNNTDNPVTLTVIAEPRPEGAISATEIRNLAKNGQHNEFIAKEMETGLTKEAAEDLYVELNTRLPALPVKTPPKVKSVSASAQAKKGKSAKKGGKKKHKKRKTKNTVKNRK